MSAELRDTRTYILCDEHCHMVSLQVQCFGRLVWMPAMFCEEADALETLYLLEANKLLDRPHRVMPISDEMTVCAAYAGDLG